MTDEELIKALRDADAYNLKHYVRDPLHTPAADRIEELVKERDDAEWVEVLRKTYQRAKEAEAKLAKAVAALWMVVTAKGLTDPLEDGYETIVFARSVLAELDAVPSR